MPLDAVYLSLLQQELSGAMTGGRIDKIHQPARHELLLSLRTPGGAVRLLLSANPAAPRAQLTQLSRENPAEAPMFCMLLRKHLSGGRFLRVEQPPAERLLLFTFEALDELGDPVEKRLVLELMGRHANLLLLDAEGRILDCMRRVDADVSAERQLLPGMFYRLPSDQGKQNPFALTEADKSRLLAHIPREKSMERFLVETFAGISPLVARELALEVGGAVDAPLGAQGEALLAALDSMISAVQRGAALPYLLLRDGKPADFSFRPILQYGPQAELRQMERFSALLDVFYVDKDRTERVRQKGQDLLRSVTTARDRTARKLGFQRKELQDTHNRETLRRAGDLITANLYRMEKGMTTLETENFYDPENAKISIRLDPLRSPQQNAARYYKDYNRAKTAEQMLTEQITKGEAELSYLQSVLESLARAEGERDLEEIRQELEEGGYIRRRAKVKGRIKRPAMKPLEFTTASGLRISVGRNNLQNDALTCKLAGRNDLWFHVKDSHGAHVILWTEGKQADAQSLTQAAKLAAYYSQSRQSGKVAVDYAAVKYVKKPAGAKPGMVIYDHYETAYVAPEDGKEHASFVSD